MFHHVSDGEDKVATVLYCIITGYAYITCDIIEQVVHQKNNEVNPILSRGICQINEMVPSGEPDFLKNRGRMKRKRFML